MFEQMDLQRFLMYAHMEARRERAETIRPGHVLLGLRQVRHGISRLLQNMPIDAARATLAPTPADVTGPMPSKIPNSPDTEHLLQRAKDEARALQQPPDGGTSDPGTVRRRGVRPGAGDAGVTERGLRERLTHRAHTSVRFELGPSPDPALLLEPDDPLSHTAFAWILSQEPFANMRLAGAVLTNTSPHRVGADTYDIAGYIHGRYAAATAILKEVDAAEQAGEDPEEALGRIRRRMIETRKPGERHWHFPPRRWLRQFRELPPPPSLVRR